MLKWEILVILSTIRSCIIDIFKTTIIKSVIKRTIVSFVYSILASDWSEADKINYIINCSFTDRPMVQYVKPDNFTVFVIMILPFLNTGDSYIWVTSQGVTSK